MLLLVVGGFELSLFEVVGEIVGIRIIFQLVFWCFCGEFVCARHCVSRAQGVQ